MPVEDSRVAKELIVEVGDDAVVGNVGLYLVGRLADAVGLGDALSDSIEPKRVGGYFVRNRGRIVTQVAMALAAGGECLSDVSMLREVPELFGDVASEATVWRTFENDLRCDDWSRIGSRLADVRAEVWSRWELTPASVHLDIDGTLSNVRTEKQGAAPTYKGGFGYHPIVCVMDRDGTAEPLSGMLRPGNAAANDIADQLAVLDAAIRQLPERLRSGHEPGADPTAVRKELVVRADTAGDSTGMLAGLVERNVEFLISGRANGELVRGIAAIERTAWRPARLAQRNRRKTNPYATENVERSAVAEITDSVQIRHLPPGTRVIVRRELRHPGAQMRLFDSETYRYQVIYTRIEGDAVSLEYRHRLRARCEQQISIFKDSGGDRWPFETYEANRNWFQTVLLAHTLMCWLAHVAFEGDLTRARPKKLRRQILAAPGRIISHAHRLILRVNRNWKWHTQIAAAHTRLVMTR